MRMDIRRHLFVYSKIFFTSLSTQRNSTDHSIRRDDSFIRFEYQVGNVEEITWIPGRVSIADPLTKKFSCLTEALKLSLQNGRLNIPFEENAETKSSIKKVYG